MLRGDLGGFSRGCRQTNQAEPQNRERNTAYMDELCCVLSHSACASEGSHQTEDEHLQFYSVPPSTQMLRGEIG